MNTTTLVVRKGQLPTAEIRTQPAAPLRFKGSAVPLLSMSLMACISKSINGTLVAVANRARLPLVKACCACT